MQIDNGLKVQETRGNLIVGIGCIITGIISFDDLLLSVKIKYKNERGLTSRKKTKNMKNVSKDSCFTLKGPLLEIPSMVLFIEDTQK